MPISCHGPFTNANGRAGAAADPPVCDEPVVGYLFQLIAFAPPCAIAISEAGSFA